MSNEKKIVVKLDLHDNKDKQKALKAVSVLVGIDAISVDMAARKMTVIGTVDPVQVVSKLRSKSWTAHLDSIGPAKEPEKKEEKKEEKKDGDGGEKKEGDGAKKDGGDGKKEEADGGKKEEGDGKKDGGEGKKEADGEGKKEDGGDGKKDGGEAGKKEEDGKKVEGEKKPAAAAVHHPWMHHQLHPQYMHMLTAADYMNQYRPPPPVAYHHPYAAAPPPPPQQQYYYVRNMSMEENPNSCAIC